MQVKEVIIKEIDLKQIMKQKGIRSFKQLSKVSGIGETYLEKCDNGYIVMGEKSWNKLKICL